MIVSQSQYDHAAGWTLLNFSWLLQEKLLSSTSLFLPPLPPVLMTLVFTEMIPKSRALVFTWCCLHCVTMGKHIFIASGAKVLFIECSSKCSFLCWYKNEINHVTVSVQFSSSFIPYLRQKIYFSIIQCGSIYVFRTPVRTVLCTWVWAIKGSNVTIYTSWQKQHVIYFDILGILVSTNQLWLTWVSSWGFVLKDN